GAVVPNRLRRDLPKYLASDDPSEARRLCEDVPSPLSSVVLSTLDAVRNAPRADVTMIAKVAESEGARQSDLIQGQTQWLLDIATIAPMVGLLGTVIGMLQAFGAVATDVAAAKPTLLAEGVSKAIVTTIFGLIIAIPMMVFYAYFRRRASKLVAELEGACAELIAVLGSKHVQG
ncbi:MAG: MotA/TolQ/ExbB proton channel family protein, partial [Kiritimatiellia bacterium]